MSYELGNEYYVVYKVNYYSVSGIENTIILEIPGSMDNVYAIEGVNLYLKYFIFEKLKDQIENLKIDDLKIVIISWKKLEHREMCNRDSYYSKNDEDNWNCYITEKSS